MAHILLSRQNFFYFYIFFDLSKIYVVIFFFQKCHPAAGWFGGKELPPDEPAVRSLAHGPWKLPPDQTAVAPYRQLIRRHGDIFEKKLYPHIFLINRRKKNIKIKKILDALRRRGVEAREMIGLTRAPFNGPGLHGHVLG